MQKSKHQTLVTYLKIHSQSKQLKTDIHKYLHSGRRETCNSVRYGVGAVDGGVVQARRGGGGGAGGGRRARSGRSGGSCGADHNPRQSWARHARAATDAARGRRLPRAARHHAATAAAPPPPPSARRRRPHSSNSNCWPPLTIQVIVPACEFFPERKTQVGPTYLILWFNSSRDYVPTVS